MRVRVWPENATPVDVPDAEVAEEFGTQLNAPSATDDDGIEFTTSGFAEMEAAGQVPSKPKVPESGLDYEFDAAAHEDLEVTTPSAGPPPPPVEDISAQTVRIDVSSFRDDGDEGEAAEEEASGGRGRGPGCRSDADRSLRRHGSGPL